MPRIVKVNRAANHYGVTSPTVRNWIGKGYFPAYRAAGVRGLLVDLDEIDAAMPSMPRRRSRQSGQAYGPNAKIKTLRRPVEVVTPGGES